MWERICVPKVMRNVCRIVLLCWSVFYSFDGLFKHVSSKAYSCEVDGLVNEQHKTELRVSHSVIDSSSRGRRRSSIQNMRMLFHYFANSHLVVFIRYKTWFSGRVAIFPHVCMLFLHIPTDFLLSPANCSCLLQSIFCLSCLFLLVNMRVLG